jgi:hypothetical protein
MPAGGYGYELCDAPLCAPVKRRSTATPAAERIFILKATLTLSCKSPVTVP